MDNTDWKPLEPDAGRYAGQPDFDAAPPVPAFKGQPKAVAPAPANNAVGTSVSAWVPVYTTIGNTLRMFPEVGKLAVEALEREHPGLFGKEDR